MSMPFHACAAIATISPPTRAATYVACSGSRGRRGRRRVRSRARNIERRRARRDRSSSASSPGPSCASSVRSTESAAESSGRTRPRWRRARGEARRADHLARRSSRSRACAASKRRVRLVRQDAPRRQYSAVTAPTLELPASRRPDASRWRSCGLRAFVGALVVSRRRLVRVLALCRRRRRRRGLFFFASARGRRQATRVKKRSTGVSCFDLERRRAQPSRGQQRLIFRYVRVARRQELLAVEDRVGAGEDAQKLRLLRQRQPPADSRTRDAGMRMRARWRSCAQLERLRARHRSSGVPSGGDEAC